MIPRFEKATAAVLQTDFHLPAEHEQPLRFGGAMKLAAEADWTLTQLDAASG